MYCTVIKTDVYKNHIALCNHKGRQDTYKELKSRYSLILIERKGKSWWRY